MRTTTAGVADSRASRPRSASSMPPSRRRAASCDALSALTDHERHRDHGPAGGSRGPSRRRPAAAARVARRAANPFAAARGVLSRRGDAEAGPAVRHQGRGVAAGERLERQAPGGRQRRLRRHHQLPGPGHGARGRLCRGQHRHRAHRAGQPTRSPTTTCSRTSRTARFTRRRWPPSASSTGSTAPRRALPTSTAARRAGGRR